MSPRHSRFLYATSLAFALAFGLLSLLWLGNPSPTIHAQTLPEALGSVSGVVRNAQGDPLPNVQVTLQLDFYGSIYREATTDSQGAYLIPSLPPGTYKLRFKDNANLYATEYYDNAARWSDASAINVSGNNLTDIDMQLAPGGTISITLQPVVPISDTILMVTLFARTATNRWEQVDRIGWPSASSNLAFYGITDGRYTVCAQRASFVDNLELAECYDNKFQDAYNQPPADATEITISGANQQHIILEFGDFSQLQGTVVSSSGQPLPNIYMSISDAANNEVFQLVSNAQGRFLVPRLLDGQYTVRMMDTSREHLITYYDRALTPVQAKPITIDASSRYSLTLVMERAGSITGTIRGEGGGIPTSVSILPIVPLNDGTWDEYYGACYLDTCRSTYEPTTGVYTVTGMSTGKYRLQVTESNGPFPYVSGYYGGTTLENADDIVVAMGKTTPNINVILGVGSFEGSIRGRATANGTPQANITVGLFRQGFDLFNPPALPLVSTQTDAQGNYHFDGLPNGFYQVGFYDQTGKYALTFYGNDLAFPPSVGITGTMTVENINAELTPGSTIRGRIKRAAGENPADFRIYIRVVSFSGLVNFGGVLPFAEITSDLNGNYEIKGLPLGTYRIGAISPDFLPYPFLVRFYPFGRDESEQSNIFVRENSVVAGIDIPVDIDQSFYLPVIGNGEQARE